MFSWLRNISLSTRIILLASLVTLAVAGVSYSVFVKRFRENAETAMMEKAAAFTAVADEAKNHASELFLKKSIAIDELLTELKAEQAKGGDYTKSRFFQTIPVVTGWSTAEKAAKSENIDFKVVAFEARNKKHEPDSGSFRANLLKDLETQLAAGSGASIGRIDRATNTLHYMRAIKLDESCMLCHGAPGGKYDPDGDGKDALGFPMEDWKVGGTHGAYEVACRHNLQ